MTKLTKKQRQIIENLEMVDLYVVEASFIVTSYDEDGEIREYTSFFTVTVKEDENEVKFDVPAGEFPHLAEQAYYDHNGQYIENEYSSSDIC